MKAIQITSGLGALALLILIPLEKDYSIKMDLLSFLMIMLPTFFASSHFVGIQNRAINEKR